MLFHAPSFSIGLVLGAAIVLTTGYLPELLAPPPEPPRTGDRQPGAAEPASQALTFEFDTILRTTPAPVAAESPEPGQPPGPLADGGIAGAPPGSAPGFPASTAAAGTSPPQGGEIENATPGVIVSGVPAVTESMPVATSTPATAAAAPAVAASAPVSAAGTGAEAGRFPASTPQPTAPAAAPEVPAGPQPAAYMLQAASFRSRADADRLRAELLLLDLPASTGEVNVGNSLWYRVTIGPFADQQTADVAKERLRERNLTAIPFRR